MTKSLGPSGRIAQSFLNSPLTPLIIVTSLLVGLFSLINLPREEEPQIIVPMIDIFVAMPGAAPHEVEERITRPMEKLLWEIPGVEYVYSTSSPGSSLAIVRFKVGEDEEKAIVRLNQKMFANFDLIPPGASQPLIKPRSIDDVPVLAITLHSAEPGHLRRIATQIHDAVKQTPDVSVVQIIGGQRRQIRVQLDPSKLAAYNVTPIQVHNALGANNQRQQAGRFSTSNQEFILESGSFLQTAAQVRDVVAGVSHNKPIFVRDVAEVIDAGEEPADYVRYATPGRGFQPAVTIAISKRKGTNAIDIAHQALERARTIKLPSGVEMTITRNYGETAAEKSNELLKHMGIAILSVSFLIAITLGLRESLIVFAAIPVTLALTLTTFYLYGYTLNRITLFALIFSIGILVDDAIVIVENMVRHQRLPENQHRTLMDIAADAVNEVGNPTILATLTVIAAILPMAFVSGLMGPYMRPIPVGASAAMIFSLAVAFIVTPFVAVRVLRKGEGSSHGAREGWATRMYRRFMGTLLHHAPARWAFLGSVVMLLLGSMALVYVQFVKVKMLPFDNKSEFQVIIDMPEGTSLEQTAEVSRTLATIALRVPEVVNVQTYTGTASPFNFNGLVRHYYLRQGSNVADIQVNLLSKDDRQRQSHEIAKDLRNRLRAAAIGANANIKVAEVPPGPPVLETLVAEVYGPDAAERTQLARAIKKHMESVQGVVDIDSYVEDDQPKHRIIVDKEKAALNGVNEATISRTLQIASTGESAGLLHDEASKEDIPILVRLARPARSSLDGLTSLRVGEGMIPIRELVRTETVLEDKSIYHKNLMPVTYVTADVAGVIESPVYAILALGPKIDALKIEQLTASLPANPDTYAMKWDGEWHITYEVFRDLGIAFAAVLVLIYVLVVGWFQSFLTPLVIMTAIPFSLIGILPAHGLLNAFFTATSMIGFIAGAGIVVRNSIILVDFIELRRQEGMPLDEAVIDAGAVRFRPMMLTAAAVVVGASVILFDPIFQGLAISLMAGEVASLFLSRMTVPIIYFLTAKKVPHPVPPSSH